MKNYLDRARENFESSSKGPFDVCMCMHMELVFGLSGKCSIVHVAECVCVRALYLTPKYLQPTWWWIVYIELLVSVLSMCLLTRENTVFTVLAIALRTFSICFVFFFCLFGFFVPTSSSSSSYLFGFVSLFASILSSLFSIQFVHCHSSIIISVSV